MNKLSHIADRAMEIAGQAGTHLKHAVTPTPEQWIKTGMAIEATRHNAHQARQFVKRNSLAFAAAAAVVGAGIAAYVVFHNRKKRTVLHEVRALKHEKMCRRRSIARRRAHEVHDEGTGISQD